MVDTQGLPHALCVTTANVTDRAGALKALSRAKKDLRRAGKVLVDGGYSGTPFAAAVRDLIDMTDATAQAVERMVASCRVQVSPFSPCELVIRRARLSNSLNQSRNRCFHKRHQARRQRDFSFGVRLRKFRSDGTGHEVSWNF